MKAWLVKKALFSVQKEGTYLYEKVHHHIKW